MASTQLSPGVVVLERDLTTVANATLDNVAVIVGSFEKGPVNEVVDITSEKELLAVFGRPNDYNYEYWYSASQFLLYGGTLKVIRSDSTALKNAIDTAQTQVTLFSASDTTLTVASSADIAQNDFLLIDAEILKVTAVNGADLSVLRAQLSTAATSHAASSAVTLIEDAGTASTINEGGTLTASDTTITVASAATLAVQINDYLKIEDEIVRCTGIAGNDLTVERGSLSTTAASHTDGVAINRLTVTASKTNINESTSTGVTAPLIRTVGQYETSVESASNSWKWGARTPGIYGNSLRIVATDAGADQILSLQQPTTAEWQFDSTTTVSYSLGNSSASVYSYSVVVTLMLPALLATSDKANTGEQKPTQHLLAQSTLWVLLLHTILSLVGLSWRSTMHKLPTYWKLAMQSHSGPLLLVVTELATRVLFLLSSVNFAPYVLLTQNCLRRTTLSTMTTQLVSKFSPYVLTMKSVTSVATRSGSTLLSSYYISLGR